MTHDQITRRSPNTIASYRDTFRLLLQYPETQTRLLPTELHVAHVDAGIIGQFLPRDEMEALLKALDQSSWFGRCDRMLLPTMQQTGLRASELAPTIPCSQQSVARL
ncbi:hypothetical protein KUG47_09875 [Falsochrobactrum sp. TDYN1]|uniref:Integrase n=1 Tax=Falsochrobactrum tianjinense TaxID=2706015 RepID=A0A949UTG6_9HYPH|nr:hypothetical protein [Falsochrobactrum sp. TDYN1]MBV2143805.1 hypothetical protein [Falsochrobactrum sp. TDYN1]